MSKTFDELWRFVCERSAGFPVVQEYHELKHVFDKMQGCHSYLEVGTAEGNSLYVLAHALPKNAFITFIDYGENHTKKAREWVEEELEKMGHESLLDLLGNSHNPEVISSAFLASTDGYEVVLIDAGHTYEDVIADAIAYGSLATKYIFFHDVCLPEVNRAFEWYCRQRPDCKAYKFINSETFGYGVLEING